jgi:hypothetical protein
MISLGKLNATLIKKCRETFIKINKNPILILGNQKSGTSAIAALLASATGYQATIDIRGIYEPIQTRIHSRTLSFAEFVKKNKVDFSKEIIKEPCLTLLFDDLAAYFRHPKFVFIVRDPRDNIRSILNRLNLPGNLENENQHPQYVDISPEWKLVVNGRWLGLSGENYIELLSERWNLMSQIYLKNAPTIEMIRYEDFLKNKRQSIENLAAKLALGVKFDISDKVNVQYQPKGDRSVTWLDFFGKENLARLERRCKNMMEHFGYKTRLV